MTPQTTFVGQSQFGEYVPPEPRYCWYKNDAATLSYIAAHPGCVAVEVCEHLGEKLTATRNRLTKLARAGKLRKTLVRRDGISFNLLEVVQ